MERSANPFYFTIGEHLGHSYSKLIHDCFGKYDFALKEIAADGIGDFLGGGAWRGLTVTIPYKIQALSVADVASDLARRIGCANVLVRNPADGKVYAYNTDYPAFLKMSENAGISYQGRHVTILGTGGAARMCRLAVADCGATSVIMVSRRPDNRAGIVSYGEIPRDTEILINATPVGMYPEIGQMPAVNFAELPHLSAVVDLIYNPRRTRLIQAAEERGIMHTDALQMLVIQGALAMELFTGEKAGDVLISETEEAVRRQIENIVLVGMPGCGKTTFGRRLAEKLGREFLDTDDMIERSAGKTIEQIFAEDGEMYFRQLENRITEIVSRRTGCVVATGGGIVLNEENCRNLRANGRILYLRQSLEYLEIGHGRPLSSSPDDIRRLATERLPIYEQIADEIVDLQHDK